MHGRLKVRSSEEQAAAKRKEREKKMKLFTAVTQRIYAKRKNGEFDEEALQLTEQMLGANPDFSTMWNIRREIFIRLKEESGFTDNLLQICKKELSLLQGCLKVNPKSYGVWHHRHWIHEFLPDADWKQELKLCNLFLSFDERNFHCWDYRRIVVKKANITATEEFKFSTDKIKENFSNYSSWHYRSKLLPLIHPDPGGDPERIEEVALMKEFELAQNAFFTDPNDQSAWFYHRWLLGRVQLSMDVICIFVRQEHGHLTTLLQFSKLVKVSSLHPVVNVNGAEVRGEWCNVFHNTQPCHVWIFNIPRQDTDCDTDVTITLLDGKIDKKVTLEKGVSEAWQVTSCCHLLRAELTALHSTLLETELESCQMLFEEEPHNKWTILTMVLLMRALDPLSHERETNDYLSKLVQVDPYRREYYNDARRKFCLENAIEKHWKSGSPSQSMPNRTIMLSNMDLSHLYHMQHLMLMRQVDLSNNKLTFLDQCNYLQCVKVLNVSDNNLKGLANRQLLHLAMLEDLLLANNCICDVSLLGVLKDCPRLRTLDLRGNPLCQSATYRQDVRRLLPTLLTLDNEVFTS